MSIEKPPTVPPQSEEKGNVFDFEIEKRNRPYRRVDSADGESALDIESSLNHGNKEFFSRMSESGKKIFSDACEGVQKVPIINMAVWKLGVAYNQFWMDRHEEKVVELKGKIDDLDSKTGELNESRKGIEESIEELKRQNFPGIESLLLEIKNIDRQQASILNERDRIKSKFDARGDKVKLYAEERDKIADKIIGYYNEKLEPLEEGIEEAKTRKDHLDLRLAVAEIKHKEKLEKVEELKATKAKLENALAKSGKSPEEIRKFKVARSLERSISDSLEEIREEKEKFSKEKSKINEEIANVEAKADPYRDKRERFARIKEGKPLEIEVPERGRSYSVSNDSQESPENDFEEAESGGEQFKISLYGFISSWNIYLKEKYGKLASREWVDIDDFSKVTGLPEGYNLEFEDFKNIINKYYKFKKVPTVKTFINLDKFFKEKIKKES